MKIRSYFIIFAGVLLLLTGCATPKEKPNYSQFRTENPRSVLVVPAINRSVDVDAPDYFLATISKPIAERGFYVFPIHLVKSVMEENGLNDANMVHSNDPMRLGKLFDADSIMYITIERWDTQYAVFSSTTTVELSYKLKSAKTGELLWKNNEKIVYQPQQNSSGGLAGLLANAIAAAIQKAAPNYIPLAQRANSEAVNMPKFGIPAGPYDTAYMKDQSSF